MVWSILFKDAWFSWGMVLHQCKATEKGPREMVSGANCDALKEKTKVSDGHRACQIIHMLLPSFCPCNSLTAP